MKLIIYNIIIIIIIIIKYIYIYICEMCMMHMNACSSLPALDSSKNPDLPSSENACKAAGTNGRPGSNRKWVIWVFPKIGGIPKWMIYNGKPY